MTNEQILFSPVGDTDPVRDDYDGAMLHIVRHYRPKEVHLFYTADMQAKDERDNRYERAIKSLEPDCRVVKAFSHIKDAHLYDAFLKDLPQAIYSLAEQNPDKQILLNLSSGTPQIKALVAFSAIDLPNAVGVQVSSPAKGSNRKKRPMQDEEDIETALSNNLDNLEGAENRCSEPELAAIKKYGVKHQILSLCRQYEYRGAFELYQQNKRLFPEVVGKLLEHALYRKDMMTKKAGEVLSDYKGSKLLNMGNITVQRITDFFQVMKICQEKAQLPELLLKLTPFLFTLTQYYWETVRPVDFKNWTVGSNGKIYLDEKNIRKQAPLVANYLDSKVGVFKRSNLSFTNILWILEYYQGHELNNDKLLTKLLPQLQALRTIEEAYRNPAAHEIFDLSEQEFKKNVNRWSSAQLIIRLQEVMLLIFGSLAKNMVDVFGKINGYVEENLNAE